jgi:small subunit ribosomal protein S17
MSEKESQTRKKRKSLSGTVTTRMGDKSVKVTVPYKIPHPLYGKVINRKTVLHAHDEKNESKPGDLVEIMETRPLSRLKRWRVTRVIDVAPDLEIRTPTEQDVAAAVKESPSTEESSP